MCVCVCLYASAHSTPQVVFSDALVIRLGHCGEMLPYLDDPQWINATYSNRFTGFVKHHTLCKPSRVDNSLSLHAEELNKMYCRTPPHVLQTPLGPAPLF